MAFTAIFDARVLHPPAVRDLLLRLAQTGLFRGRWTDQILDVTMENVLRLRPDLEVAQLARTRKLMCEAVPDCLVTGYEPLMSGLSLPDGDDRHVLAAAIRCSAQVIVTTDAAAFPAASVEPFNIEAQSPDEFVLDLVDLAPARVAAVVQQESSALRAPPRSAGTLLDDLSSLGLPRTAAALRASFDG